MKKTWLIFLSFVILLTSVLTVAASAEDYDFEDDMHDDDTNYYVTDPATTSSNGISGILGGNSGSGSGSNSGAGGFVGEVVSKVFDDEDVSEGVGGRFDTVMGLLNGFDFELGDFVQKSTEAPQATTGSNFFDVIDPVVSTTVSNAGNYGSNSGLGNYTPGYTPQGNSSSSYATVPYSESLSVPVETINPYAKPTVALKQGDEGDGVKWLQWILSNTPDSGFSGTVSGVYDDATAAAVKNLQLKHNLDVDGNASLEVIEKAEQTYNEYASGVLLQGSTAPQAYVPDTTVASETQNDSAKAADIKVTIIIVVLVVVWIFAIAIIFIIIHIKRRNITPDDVDSNGRIKKEALSRKPKKASKSVARQSFKKSDDLRKSETLKSLSDEQDNEKSTFEVVTPFGFTEADDDDGEITLASLYEMKQRKPKKSTSDDEKAESVKADENKADEDEADEKSVSEDSTEEEPNDENEATEAKEAEEDATVTE